MVEMAETLRVQAGHCARLGSPLYADLLERAAADAENDGPVARILRGHEHDPPDSMLALRLMGAVHRRVLEGALPGLSPHYQHSPVPFRSYARKRNRGDVWEVFRQALIDDRTAIGELIGRPVQTNDVGRCAALLPGFLIAAEETAMPLRLLEIGASAGLNLHWDRYRYEADGFAWGLRGAPLTIGFELEGAMPKAPPIEIAGRRGCDLRPVDPTTEEGRLTLLSFVWPDQVERMVRLRAALEIATEAAIEIEPAGAAEWVGDRLAEPGFGVTTVVFHSIVMQYLPDDERTEFEGRVRAAGKAAGPTAPLVWLRMEPAGEMAELRLTVWPGGEERLLARVGYHGNPVRLLG